LQEGSADNGKRRRGRLQGAGSGSGKRVISWEDAVSVMLGDSSKGFVITPRKKKELTDKICSAIRKVPCSLDFSAHNPEQNTLLLCCRVMHVGIQGRGVHTSHCRSLCAAYGAMNISLISHSDLSVFLTDRAMSMA